MNMAQLNKTLINVVQIPAKVCKPRESQIFVRRNKALKWRGQEILEGRILTIIVVPNERVHEVLAISGKHGLIIDLARRDVKEEHEKECANVRLPEEWGIKEALTKTRGDAKAGEGGSERHRADKERICLESRKARGRGYHLPSQPSRSHQTWACHGNQAQIGVGH